MSGNVRKCRRLSPAADRSVASPSEIPANRKTLAHNPARARAQRPQTVCVAAKAHPPAVRRPPPLVQPRHLHARHLRTAARAEDLAPSGKWKYQYQQVDVAIALQAGRSWSRTESRRPAHLLALRLSQACGAGYGLLQLYWAAVRVLLIASYFNSRCIRISKVPYKYSKITINNTKVFGTIRVPSSICSLLFYCSFLR